MQPKLVINSLFAEPFNDLIPISTFCVQAGQFLLGLRFCDIRHDGRLPDAVPGTREAADELQRNRKRLVGVVQGGDLQVWEIEPLAKHIDANNNASPFGPSI